MTKALNPRFQPDARRAGTLKPNSADQRHSLCPPQTERHDQPPSDPASQGGRGRSTGSNPLTRSRFRSPPGRRIRNRGLVMLATTGVIGALAGLAATPAASANSPTQPVSGDTTVTQLNLVSDIPGAAMLTDPNLVNAWGLAASPSSPIWVSDNGTSTSVLYTGATADGVPPSKVPLDVAIPGGGNPTGAVFNPTNRFVLSSGGKSGPSLFIFAGENGDITAWNKTGDITQAVLVAHTPNAVYKGLTMVRHDGKAYLLAANFHNNRIDVFNSQFARVRDGFPFPSRMIPHGYAPFDVAALGDKVYVSYAKQNAARHDDVAGPHHGFIDVFDTQGRFLDQLVRGGVLDSPWGMTIAPVGFGDIAGKLLVGNFGDGHIFVVGRDTGNVLGTLRDASGAPIVIDGLWGLLPGNGVSGGTSDIWFSAGPDAEANGLLGILRPMN